MSPLPALQTQICGNNSTPSTIIPFVNQLDYEQAVSSFYEGLYRFAFSLADKEDDACELTQETYARLLAKGGQLRDPEKVKSWLFTTLYRILLRWKTRQARLPHHEVSSVEHELPPVSPATLDFLEDEAVRQALLSIEEHYRFSHYGCVVQGGQTHVLAGNVNESVSRNYL
jgi:hypothetical protein